MFNIYEEKAGQAAQLVAECETLDDATMYLKGFLEEDFGGMDNYAYWDDDSVGQVRHEVFTADPTVSDPCKGYEGAGWYKAGGAVPDGYELLYSDEMLDSIDFQQYSYDNVRVYIEEFYHDRTLENIFYYPSEFDDESWTMHQIAYWSYADMVEQDRERFKIEMWDDIIILASGSRGIWDSSIPIEAKLNKALDAYAEQLFREYKPEVRVARDAAAIYRFAKAMVDWAYEAWSKELI